MTESIDKPSDMDTLAPLIGKLLSDTVAMDRLTHHRNPSCRQTDNGGVPRQLYGIFDACQSVARRLVYRNIDRFPDLVPQDIEDIKAEQDLRLWQVLIDRFDWWRYTPDLAEKAGASLIIYMDKMSGSFFAKDALREEVCLPTSKDGHDQLGDVLGNPEIIYLRKEQLLWLRDRLEVWWEMLTPAEKVLIEKIQESGQSATEIARSSGRSVSAGNDLLRKARKKLYGILSETEADMGEIPGPNLVKDTRLGVGTRQELLEMRRVVILSRPGLFELLPPKTKQALTIYYGLDGKVPVFDYEKTATIMGVSVTSLKVSIPKGFRVIVGTDILSKRSIHNAQQKKLYERWETDRAKFGLDGIFETVLELRFGRNLSYEKVGVEMGVSYETARRYTKRALWLIGTI